jgi:hypothetical protein
MVTANSWRALYNGGVSTRRVLILWLLVRSLAAADCIPFAQAREHIGETQCVTGKVLRVKSGQRGVTFFDYCEDFRVCPFTVVVFPGHLKDIGDVRQLANRVVEIRGTVKEYDGRAEVVLQDLRQLSGGAKLIPPMPKKFDVEKKGKYSAGTFSLPGVTKAAARKKQPATLPVELPPDEE